jgi:hypothetical protein
MITDIPSNVDVLLLRCCVDLTCDKLSSNGIDV